MCQRGKDQNRRNPSQKCYVTFTNIFYCGSRKKIYLERPWEHGYKILSGPDRCKNIGGGLQRIKDRGC